jgi:undecaprenyl-diphosphatase
MTLYHALLLGLVQGLTEFLPVSSSGHLVLLQTYFGLQLESAVLQHFDIVLHAGSLVAILLYFSKTWLRILHHPFRKEKDGGPPLLLVLTIASVPLGITGYLSAEWIERSSRTPLFVAFGFIFTGAFLITSGWFESRFASKETVGWKQALGSGIGQAIGVLPGFSRSGMTISSARLMGLSATRATELAFLLGAPALSGALLYTLGSGQEAVLSLGKTHLLVGLTTSLFSSLAVIHFFLRTIRCYGVWMWAAYLFVAAALIIGDEMMPFVHELPEIGKNLDMRILAGALFIALFLEAAPFTSLFTPGFATMVAVGVLLRDQPMNILSCIVIGSSGLLLGNLLGYIPARQARLNVRWKEKTDRKLTQAQHFFRKWGIAAVFCGNFYGPTRSVLSIAAGLSNMRPLPYIVTVLFGSLAWVSITLILSSKIASWVLL